jgi:hypothetical protein
MDHAPQGESIAASAPGESGANHAAGGSETPPAASPGGTPAPASRRTRFRKASARRDRPALTLPARGLAGSARGHVAAR